MYEKESDSDFQVVREAHGGDGAIRIHGFFQETLRLPVRVAVWELDPGASEGRHAHGDERPLEEMYYFLEGEGVMWMGEDEVAVSAGEAVLAPAGVDHGLRNTGDRTMRLVIVWGTPSDQEDNE
ncbi:MAG: cupin domain-containing protein [Chloroflexi bacterium]|nr:cupin domain-containing protein [Chloroflexota bacterium]